MDLLKIFGGELLGTMILILLGNGVVANVVFKKTIGTKSGWIVITFGWAMAVLLGILTAQIFATGGHLNPAITVGALAAGSITIAEAAIFVLAQFLGAMIGQSILNIFYNQHIKEETTATVLSMHSTGPTHQNWMTNVFSEYVGTAVLAIMAFIAVAALGKTDSMPVLNYLMIAFTVLAIGLSLGGTTGYAINPARDLGPRVVYWIMYKTARKWINPEGLIVDANWKYSWIPVVAPLVAGATIGAFSRLA